jgi:RNA polymerase sigma factor for flagellar operon FliA
VDALATYQTVSKETTESLVQAHAVLVKRLAYHMLGKLPQTVQLDDLIQAGMMGLLDALRQYDATKGASFETYATIRIRGHMLDEVRRNDWVPRSVYKNSRMISEEIKKLENALGREAKDSEIAQAMNITMEAYHAMLQDNVSSVLYGFDDVGVDDDSLTGWEEGAVFEPHKTAMHDEMMAYVSNVIDGLPQKEKLVLSLYYEQDLNLKEIGEVIGVSESRVSQILSQAVQRIRARMANS